MPKDTRENRLNFAKRKKVLLDFLTFENVHLSWAKKAAIKTISKEIATEYTWNNPRNDVKIIVNNKTKIADIIPRKRNL